MSSAEGSPQAPGASSELRRRRDRLAEEVAELQWALGGLTYEMAIRDHFRVDVLLRRAAVLQQREGELAEIERLLHMQESSIAGNCAACGAVRSRGAVYCWQCGTAMMERTPLVSDVVNAELGAVIDEDAPTMVKRPAALPVAAPAAAVPGVAAPEVDAQADGAAERASSVERSPVSAEAERSLSVGQ